MEAQIGALARLWAARGSMGWRSLVVEARAAWRGAGTTLGLVKCAL